MHIDVMQALPSIKSESNVAIRRGGLLRAASALVSLGLCASALTMLTPAYAQTTLTVASNADTGGSSATGTLRQVLQYASTSCYLGAIDIVFAIGPSPQTIAPATPLPTIICPGLTINGYSNPGATTNTLASDWDAALNVTLDAGSCTACDGLQINAPNVSIKGINFTNWDAAVRISGMNAFIAGNYFFQGAIGVAHDSGDNAQIGTNAVADRNVFVHATAAGVQSQYNGVMPPLIMNNLIGLGASAVAGPNAKGIFFNGIGGGIVSNNVIANNAKGLVIGPTASGVTYLPNMIFGNGIAVDLGDNGLSANDDGIFPYDTDTGGNLAINFPTITSLVPTSASTADLNFELKSTASQSFDIFYCVNPGGGAQCESMIVAIPVTTDGTGFASGIVFLNGLTAGTAVTMIARATSGPKAGNMSEISPAVNFVLSPLTITPGAINLQPTPVGWVRGQIVNAMNSSGSTVTVTSFGVTGDPSLGTTTTGPDMSCPNTINIGGNCGYGTDFTPTTVGSVSGTLTLNTSAGVFNVPIMAIGTVGASPPTASAPSLSFPNTVIGGTSMTQTLTFTNPFTGPSSVNVPYGYYFQAGDTSSFTVQSSTCGGDSMAGAPVPQGASCTVTIAFTPQGPAGAKTLPISVQFVNPDDFSYLQFNIPLSGLAVAPAPTVSVSGTTAFPNTTVGGSSTTQAITITNTGASTLSISSITHSNASVFPDTTSGPAPNAAHYCGFGSLAGGAPNTGAPINIAPGNACVLNLIFAPNATGALSGSITITSNAIGSPLTFVVSGSGTAPLVTAVPTSLSFGSTAQGTQS
ncbi:MAG: choice-of-anchor D domain-containing protein, partial [Betaproteobacteria bacterium]